MDRPGRPARHTDTQSVSQCGRVRDPAERACLGSWSIPLIFFSLRFMSALWALRCHQWVTVGGAFTQVPLELPDIKNKIPFNSLGKAEFKTCIFCPIVFYEKIWKVTNLVQPSWCRWSLDQATQNFFVCWFSLCFIHFSQWKTGASATKQKVRSCLKSKPDTLTRDPIPRKHEKCVILPHFMTPAWQF